ncbi:MAG: hypothetical protein KDI21_11115 [Halieaceae bacterium]|nr:hypothetical protein [Halieaceae bacterium]
MIVKKCVLVPLFLALGWMSGASGFRSCDIADSYAWSASTHYTVGEIAFDAVTGTASGTETRYNFSNDASDGAGECHVTYELTGTYDVGVEVFTLDATRTNYSESCAPALLGVEYPQSRLYALQMAFGEDGTARVSSAASGEMLASGSWQAGRAVYKTPEECTLF